MIDLNYISKIALEHSKTRQRNGSVENGSTLNLLKHCAGEVIEAMNAFDDWQEDLKFGAVSMGVTDPDWNRKTPKEEFVGELADIIMCILIIAAQKNVDIEEALKNCLEKNRKRAEI